MAHHVRTRSQLPPDAAAELKGLSATRLTHLWRPLITIVLWQSCGSQKLASLIKHKQTQILTSRNSPFTFRLLFFFFFLTMFMKNKRRVKQEPAYVSNKNTSGTKQTYCMLVPSPGVIYTRCCEFSCGLSIREADMIFTAQPQSLRWEGPGGVSDTLWSLHATHLNACFCTERSFKCMFFYAPYTIPNVTCTSLLPCFRKLKIWGENITRITSIGPYSPDDSDDVRIHED